MLQAPSPPRSAGLPMQAMPGGSMNPIAPPSVPNLSMPNSRRSAIPDVVTPTLGQAATPSVLAFTSPDTNAPASLFSRLMSAGPGSLLAADGAASPPLQPDATPDATDNGPTPFLVGRPYDPSQGSPFKAQAAPAAASADGSLSLNDAYLEYLRRLNAN